MCASAVSLIITLVLLLLPSHGNERPANSGPGLPYNLHYKKKKEKKKKRDAHVPDAITGWAEFHIGP